jgi:hypothetical protein
VPEVEETEAQSLKLPLDLDWTMKVKDWSGCNLESPAFDFLETRCHSREELEYMRQVM